jgi:V8-like Glu-specific endopeptidase
MLRPGTRQRGSAQHPAGSRHRRGSTVKALAVAVTATALAAMLLVPAAPATARLASRLAGAVHTLARQARQTPAGERYPVPPGTSAAVGALFSTAGTVGPSVAASGATTVTIGGQHRIVKLGGHFCTASVVDSPGGDLALTAAHCLAGLDASHVVFVPEYRDGAAPFGVWQVTQEIVGQAWSQSASQGDDVAFLQVHQTGTARTVQSFTGGERLGFGEPTGQLVRVTGYPDNGQAPVSCLNRATAYESTDLRFECDGFPNGTSGSALLADISPVTGLGTVLGVIGGYQQGGYTASVSYADRLGPAVEALYKQAIGR